MHALIVVSHPDLNSLTHRVAAQISAGIANNGSADTFEIADISAEGFDPRFAAGDLAAFRDDAELPADVRAEQARIDRADALVLIYPVYWWSMPGLMKGWIDRVFTNGWAYDDRTKGKVVKKLQHLPIHLVALGGADLRTYARHGYFGAMRTQIDHGIFGYCGAPVLTTELLLDQPDGPDAMLKTALTIGQSMLRKTERTRAA